MNLISIKTVLADFFILNSSMTDTSMSLIMIDISKELSIVLKFFIQYNFK